jgi:hypothetical protein
MDKTVVTRLTRSCPVKTIVDGETQTAKVKKKSKALPVTGRGDIWGCEMLRIPQCLESRLTDCGEVFSLTHRPRFSSRKIFWYLFLLEAE